MLRRLAALLLSLALLAGPALAEESETDGEARRVVMEAMEVYAWFVMTPLDVNLEAAPTENGLYPLLDAELARPQALQQRLDRYFSADISRSLWEWGAYTLVNGWLYAPSPDENPFARPVDANISDTHFALTSDTENRRVYTATVYYLDADQPAAYEFVCEYQDGLWVFTEFPFFW